MKRIRRAYSKTVSLIDETAVQIYQSFVGKKKGFLLESYDKNYDRVKKMVWLLRRQMEQQRSLAAIP